MVATSSVFAHGSLPSSRLMAPASHAGRRVTCRLQQITHDDLAKNPWIRPGWRGAYVSSQPEATQTVIVAGVTLLGALLTYFAYTTAGPWICDNVPLMDNYLKAAPFLNGPLFFAAGVAHFYPIHKEFCQCYPHKGAWGFWYLPGSPSFHVWWTGVAEILGGLGIVLGALDLPFAPDWLLQASSFGLFLLVTVVSPANIYMWTHNSPGPANTKSLDKLPNKVLPLRYHIIRGLLQVVLLATFLGLAFHKY